MLWTASRNLSVRAMSALALGLANVSPRFLTDHNFLKTILNFYTSLQPGLTFRVRLGVIHKPPYIRSIRAIYSDGVPLCAQPLGSKWTSKWTADRSIP